MERFIHEYDSVIMELIIDVTVYKNDQRRTVKALIDTGCNKTSVSPKLAREMGLRAIAQKDMRDMSNHIYHSPMYEVALTIGDSIHLPVGKIVEFPFKTDKYDIVIGMDILSLCDFIVTNCGGHTKLTIISNLH